MNELHSAPRPGEPRVGTRATPEAAAPHIAYGPWWILYSGPLDPSPSLRHPTFKLVVHAGGPCVIDEQRHALAGPIVTLEPHQLHHVVDHRDHALIIHIDPESEAGAALADHRRRPADGPGHPVSRVLGGLRPENWSRAEEAVRRAVTAVADAPSLEQISWWRQPLIDQAILAAGIDATIDERWLAAQTGIDIDRLRAMFSKQVGTTCTAYARWIRVAERLDPAHGNAERSGGPDYGVTVNAESPASGLLDGASWPRTQAPIFLRP